MAFKVSPFHMEMNGSPFLKNKKEKVTATEPEKTYSNEGSEIIYNEDGSVSGKQTIKPASNPRPDLAQTMAKMVSPLNQSTIKNPKFLELTQKEKDEQHAIARKNDSIHTYKGVQFDPEDGALSRMKNPNYKKEPIKKEQI